MIDATIDKEGAVIGSQSQSQSAKTQITADLYKSTVITAGRYVIICDVANLSST
jgi:hypothetical protein